MSCNCQKPCGGGGHHRRVNPLVYCAGYGYDRPCSCKGQCDCVAVDPNVKPWECCCCCCGPEPLMGEEGTGEHHHGHHHHHHHCCCDCKGCTLNYGCCKDATTWGRCN